MKLFEFKPTEEVLERVSKCITAEEVEKLAQEYDVQLTTEEIAEILKYNCLTELRDDQLDQVAGGGDDWGHEKAEHLPYDHGRHIGKYEAEGHIGERVYCVNDDHTDQFCWGILQRSYEEKLEKVAWGAGSNRCHDILIQGWNDSGDVLTCYNVSAESFPALHISPGRIFDHIDGDKCTLFLKMK